MQPDRDAASFTDIALACRHIIQFTNGMNRGTFFADLKTQSAVIHQLLIIGEAVKRLSDEVWKIINTDIASLLSSIEPQASPPDEGA